MDSSLSKFTRSFRDRHKKNRQRKFVLGSAAAAVLVATSVVMSLPAITATPELVCGMEEHTHTDACYTETKTLICGQEESAGHTHSDSCYTEHSHLVCGQEERAGHTHSDSCYTAQTSLVCGQQERAGHTHSSSCYDEDGNLICGQAEDPGHTHSDSCYHTEYVLTCGQAEDPGHTHSDSCYETERVLSCGETESAGHTHTDECYETSKEMTCGKEEHTHTKDCYEKGGKLTSQTSDKMTAEVSYEAGVLHDGSALSAKLLQNKDEQDAKWYVNQKLAGENKEVSEIYAYDLSVSTNGSWVQPDGNVDVTMTFGKTVTSDIKDIEWRFFYINSDGTVKELTKDSTTSFKTRTQGENLAIEKLSFRTDKLNWYVLAGVTKIEAQTEPANEEIAAEAESENITEAAAEAATEEETEEITEIAAETETEEPAEAAAEAETENTEVITETETEEIAEVTTEAETEEATEAATEVETEEATEAATEAETEMASEAVETEIETEAAAESESETELVEETEIETELVEETEIETEAAAEVETETETEIETEVAYPEAKFVRSANGIKVSVFAEEGAFPEGTTMKVTKVTDSAVLDEAIAASGMENAEAAAVDISFYDAEGNSIEPSRAIRVTMQADVVAENEVTVVHVDDDNNAQVIEQTDSAVLAADEQPAENQVVFDSDAFSVYALVYTVDFYFGDYEYHLQGGESMMLSELLDVLKIKKNKDGDLLTVEDIQSVKFSDESLLKVTEENGDWKLESLQAFDTEEELSITLHNQDLVIIRVEDDQNSNSTADISSLLKAINISGATKNADGSYNVSAGDTYSIDLSFAEKNNLQFDTDNPLTYQLPDGFIAKSQSGKGTAKTSAGSITFTYNISESGLITITWPEDKSSDAWKAFEASQYASLLIHIDGEFDGKSEEIDFGASGGGKVKIDNEHDVKVYKTGRYDAATNKVYYTVTVTSEGHNSNVKITDTVKGSALTYDKNLSSSRSGDSYTEDAGGFVYTALEMRDGEVITLSYSASVNLDGVSKNGDVIGTYDETANTVKVEADGNEDHETTVEGKDLTNKISYSTISKSAGSVTDKEDDDSKKILSWQIFVNSDANLSMGGKKITDTNLTPDVMSYTGKGISVQVFNKNGALVRIDEVAWGENGLVFVNDQTGWEYTIPESDKGNNYSYVISYDTEVDVSSGKSVTVKNKADDEFGGSGEVPKSIGDTGTGDTGSDDLPVTKSATKIDVANKEITWKITADVPKEGFNKLFEVWDSLPTANVEVANEWKQVWDAYKTDSIKINNLLSNEEYELDTSEEGKIGIIFYYTENGEKKTGLSASDESRTIEIVLTSTINDDYLKQAEKEGYEYLKNHYNSVDVFENDVKKNAGANAHVDTDAMSVSKTSTISTNVVNGVEVPAFYYEIKLTGINDSSFDDDGKLILTDKYDSEFFAWLSHAYSSWEEHNGYIYGGTIDNAYGSGYLQSKVIEEKTSGELTITIDKNLIPKDGESYYSVYVIPYYLSVKNAEALNNLKSKAESSYNGSYVLHNEVSGEKTGSAENDAEYQVDILTKSASNPELNESSGQYEVDFTIVANPDGAQIGSENYLTLTDKLTNLNVDVASIKAVPSSGVSWIKDNDRYVFTIPNATRVEITYTARIIGSGTVEYSNVADLYGQTKKVEGSQKVNSSVEGDSKLYYMNLYKYEEGDLKAALAGAEFDLYILDDGYFDDPDNRYSQPAADDSRWVMVNNEDKPFVSGADGKITIDYKSLQEHDSQPGGTHAGLYRRQWYKLVERTAPTVSGTEYQLSDTPYYFWIDDAADADYKNNIYTDGDIVLASNKPKDSTKMSLTVNKTWDVDDVSKIPDEIVLRVYQKANKYASNDTAVEYGDPIILKKSDFIGDDGQVNKSWSTVIENLPTGFTYFIKEDSVKGYLPIYDAENNYGYDKSNTVNLTNKKQEITIRKIWYDQYGNIVDAPSDNVETIRVNLLKDGKFYETYLLNADNKWQITLDNLDFPGEFTVYEQGVSGYTLKSIEYQEEGDTDSSSRESLNRGGTITISNQPSSGTPTSDDKTTLVEVEKKWFNESGDEIEDNSILDNLSAKVMLVRYKAKVQATRVHLYTFEDNLYTELYNNIYVYSDSGQVTLTFKGTNTNSAPKLFALTRTQMTDYLNGANFWALNNNSSGIDSTFSGNYNESKITYTFNLNNGEDIYLLGGYVSSLSNCDVGEYTPKPVEAATLDSEYQGPVIILDKYNSWKDAFNNLPVMEVDSATGEIYKYTYGVKEISCSDGFEIDSYTVDSNKKSANADDVSDPGAAITVANKQSAQTMDFSFSKIWKNASDQTLEWAKGQSIKVTLYAELISTDEEKKLETNTYEYEILYNEDSKFIITQKDTDPEMSYDRNNDGLYEFTISKLPKTETIDGVLGNWKYYIKESELEKYTTIYRKIGTDGKLLTGSTDELEYVEDDGAIVNKEKEYYNLPNTGGAGTFKFIFGGLSLMMIALLLLLRRNTEGRRAM